MVGKVVESTGSGVEAESVASKLGVGVEAGKLQAPKIKVKQIIINKIRLCEGVLVLCPKQSPTSSWDCFVGKCALLAMTGFFILLNIVNIKFLT